MISGCSFQVVLGTVVGYFDRLTQAVRERDDDFLKKISLSLGRESAVKGGATLISGMSPFQVS